jgi:hypothetical protein
MKTKTTFGGAVCAWLISFLASTAAAQLPGGGQAGLNAALLRLFGDAPSFSSKADVRLQDKSSRALTTLATDFSILDGNLRMEVDMATVKSSQVPQKTLDMLRSAGLNHLITVVRPDRKNVMLIYPGARAYAEIPMTKDEAADVARLYRVEKKVVGKEKVGIYACEKTKVVVRADSGEKHEAVVWYAKELNNFPVRIQFDQPDASVVMEYRDVKLAAPARKDFEAPSGFARYTNAEQLMQNAMLKAAMNAR